MRTLRELLRGEWNVRLFNFGLLRATLLKFARIFPLLSLGRRSPNTALSSIGIKFGLIMFCVTLLDLPLGVVYR